MIKRSGSDDKIYIKLPGSRCCEGSRQLFYFFDISMKLHEAKMDCILSLSRGTSEKEKRDFEMRALAREIKIAVERFLVFPEEKEQCIERINDIVFGPVDEVTKEILLSFQK